MQVLRILGALALALGVASATSTAPVYTSSPLTNTSDAASDASTPLAGGNSACGSKRVRKPWSSLTLTEQETYLEAAALAIKNGIVSDLAAMHIEDMGEAQAHHSCAFFTWHRRMLLAYESYLRDLGPKYACVTIPYYDAHTAYVQAANKKCGNMFDCSPIFRAMGGDFTETETTMTLNGQYATGYKVQGPLFANNCDDDNKTCGCMIRNNLKQHAVPSGAGFASFQNIVMRSRDYATFLEGIQFGIHNEIHNAVGGIMSTFASPRDIFFFSWHGAIDMYLHVYHLCHIGVPLTASELQTSLEAFTAASQSCGGVSGVGAKTKVVQNVRVNGTLMDATQHPTLGKYFAHVGDEMWNYGDPQQLGDYSYTYELPAILTKQLLSNKDMCPGFNKATAASAPSKASSSLPRSDSGAAGTVDIVATKPATPKPVHGSTKKPSNGGYGFDDMNDSTDNTDAGDRDVKAGSTRPSASSSSGSSAGAATGVSVGYDAYGKSIVGSAKTHSGIIVSEQVTGAPGATGGDDNGAVAGKTSATAAATSGDYWVWLKTTYDGLVARFDGNMELVAQQMQLIECQAFDAVFGVTEFSSDFVKNFHLASRRPLCGKKVDEIQAGNVTVAAATGAFKAETIKFGDAAVIQTVINEYAPLTTSVQPLIDAAFVKKAEAAIATGGARSPTMSAGDATQSTATGAEAAAPMATRARKSKTKTCDY